MAPCAGSFARADQVRPTWSYHGAYRMVRWNARGIGEYRIERREDHWVGSGTWNPLLYARDLDADGKPDAWFYRDARGLLEGKDEPASSAEGWEVADRLLRDLIPNQERLYAGILLNHFLTTMTFTFELARNEVDSALSDELNLASLEIEALRLWSIDPLNPEIDRLLAVVIKGYDEIVRRLGTPAAIRVFATAAFDGGVAYAGGLAFKGAELMLKKLLGTKLLSFAGSLCERYLTRYAEGLGARSQRLWRGVRGTQKTLSGAEAAAVARVAATQEAGFLVRAIVARAQLTNGILKTFVSEVAKKGWEQKGYVATTMGVQVLAEGWTRRKEIRDPNPLVMAERFATNQEFLQNFAYMSSETFWMAGLSTYFPKMGAKILACGLFSLADSALVNFVIRRSVDPIRAGMDMAWEVTVGNFQTQLDMKLVPWLNRLAEAQSNPKLKLLGYMVAIVEPVADQGLGYLLYPKAQDWVEKRRERIRTYLVPVLGPAP